MQSDRFDDLARSLARGLTRRYVLKGLAVGAGAHLFSALGLGSGPLAATKAHAADGLETYLPVILSPGYASDFISICAVPSSCDNKQYCNESGNPECRCILSAEGEMRCGAPASCGARRCTTSADCADLGPGYFCDTPGSGCCDDGAEEQFQRCLAPCPEPLPCPEARLCGSTCCEANAFCQDGVCIDPTTGTWTGSATYEEQSIGIRFILEHAGGDLKGRMLLQDPVTLEYLETGTLDGSRSDRTANWQNESGSNVYGEFTDTSFSGNIFFPARNDEESFFADLTLQRTGD